MTDDRVAAIGDDQRTRPYDGDPRRIAKSRLLPGTVGISLSSARDDAIRARRLPLEDAAAVVGPVEGGVEATLYTRVGNVLVRVTAMEQHGYPEFVARTISDAVAANAAPWPLGARPASSIWISIEMVKQS